LLGVWCPEGRSIRLTVFDPDKLQPFDLAEIAGWFKQSSDRIYFQDPTDRGVRGASYSWPWNAQDQPPTGTGLQSNELIVPTSYKATSNDDPAFALFVLYLQAGLVEVFAAEMVHRLAISGRQTMDFTRVPRPGVSSHLRECLWRGTFLLEEDGLPDGRVDGQKVLGLRSSVVGPRS